MGTDRRRLTDEGRHTICMFAEGISALQHSDRRTFSMFS